MILPISHTAANIAGFAGMACIIFAYGYATWQTAPNPFVQHGVNLLGAALLTVSLLVNLNPASLVLEFFWAAIAIWGLAKAFRARTSSSQPLAGGVGGGPEIKRPGSDRPTPTPSRRREGNS